MGRNKDNEVSVREGGAMIHLSGTPDTIGENGSGSADPDASGSQASVSVESRSVDTGDLSPAE